MGSFGENLRRERELRGITLPELSEATKIGLRYLRALENNRFDYLPGGVFNRGFVRAVARYLKLDERHWVAEFARAAHESPEIVAHYAPPAPPPAAASRRGLWSLLALVAAFTVGAYIVHEIRAQRAAVVAQAARPAVVSPAPTLPEASVTQASDVRTVPARVPPAAPSVPAPASSTRSPQTGEEGALEQGVSSVPPIQEAAVFEPGPESPAPAGELRLQIDVMDDAWMSVRVDGRQAYSGIMKSRESLSFQGVRQIELITGNASAVVLTLNGETLAPLGNPGERKRIVLTAKDLRPPSP